MDMEILYSTVSTPIAVTIHLFLVILIAIAVGAVATLASGVNIASPTFAQNVTSGNTTGENSTQSLTTSEERGAYNDYGG
jgi:hypothetical protein